MKRAILGCVLGALLATPAGAQPRGGANCHRSATPVSAASGRAHPRANLAYDWDINGSWRNAASNPRARMQIIERRIHRASADGSLDRNETKRAIAALSGIRRAAVRLATRLEDHGCAPTQEDRRMLAQRLDDLDRQLDQAARHGK